MADNNEKKQQAQFLYMAGGKTQKEIADLVGVSERTIYSWVHQLSWDKLRLAAYQAPLTITDNLCSQLVELQTDIAKREPGKRYPTPQEAETTRKLIICLERMKKYPSLSQTMQVLETFRNYVRPLNKDAATTIGKFAESFVEKKSVNGYAPYQPEYGVEPVSPVMPFYEEVEGLDPDIHEQDRLPCPDIHTCLHPGKCRYPRCEKQQPRYVTEDDYKVSPAAYTRPTPQQDHHYPNIAAETTGSIPAMVTPVSETENNHQHMATQPEVTGSNSATLETHIISPDTVVNNASIDNAGEYVTPPSPSERAGERSSSIHIINTGIDPFNRTPIRNSPLKKILPHWQHPNRKNHAA